jgi:hypothetical protein
MSWWAGKRRTKNYKTAKRSSICITIYCDPTSPVNGLTDEHQSTPNKRPFQNWRMPTEVASFHNQHTYHCQAMPWQFAGPWLSFATWWRVFLLLSYAMLCCALCYVMYREGWWKYSWKTRETAAAAILVPAPAPAEPVKWWTLSNRKSHAGFDAGHLCSSHGLLSCGSRTGDSDSWTQGLENNSYWLGRLRNLLTVLGAVHWIHT